MKKRRILWVLLLTFVLIVVITLTIIYRLSIADRRLITETEQRVILIEEQINNRLLAADNFLRFFSAMYSDRRPEVLDPEKLRDHAIRELLFHPEISYLRIFDETGELSWASSLAPPVSNEGKELIEKYESYYLDFDISDTNVNLRDEKAIQMSRVSRNSEGKVELLFEVGLSEISLFPLEEDLRHDPVVCLGLRDRNLDLLLDHRYIENDSVSPEARRFFYNFAGTGFLMDGSHIIRSGHYTIALHQLHSFPFYLSMIRDVRGELQSDFSHIFLTSTLFVLLALITFFISSFIQQYRYSSRLSRQNLYLEDLNQQLEKTSEERKLLIQEIHHRVKNNLSLVNNIINMMIMEGGPYSEETLHDLDARIMAIQKVHDSLYHNENLTQVELHGYLDEITGMILSSSCSFPVEVANAVKPFALHPKKIIPLGILIAELITNAIKYGLESGGTISYEGELDEHGWVNLTVSNDGRPYNEGKKGLGSRLIDGLMTQLEGTIRLESTATTTFRIRFPA